MANCEINGLEDVTSIDTSSPKSENLSLDTMVLLLNTERLKSLREKLHQELSELKDRQAKVKLLHKLLRIINAGTDSSGKFDGSKNAEFKELLNSAKELGVEIDTSKMTYNKDERERLIENIRITVSDFNVENEMQMQAITRLNNERTESYQLARSILKPLHDAKMRHARSMSGAGG